MCFFIVLNNIKDTKSVIQNTFSRGDLLYDCNTLGTQG